MLSGYLVLSMLALVIVLLALLLAAYYIGGSRTKQLREAVDALRSRADKIQSEILSTRTQIGDLRSSVEEFRNPPLHLQGEAAPLDQGAYPQQEEMLRLKAELHEIRKALTNHAKFGNRTAVDKTEMPADPQIGAAPASIGESTGRDGAHIQTRPQAPNHGKLPAWQADLGEILDGVREAQGETEK